MLFWPLHFYEAAIGLPFTVTRVLFQTSYTVDGLHQSLQWMTRSTLHGALGRGSVSSRTQNFLSQQPHLILQGILTHKISLQHLSCLQAKEMDFVESSVD